MKSKVLLVVVAFLVGLLPLLTACSDAHLQREASIKARSQTFERAEMMYPIPQTQGFPARQMLVKFTEREDLTNHLYYVYVYSDVGTIIGYYVAQSFPVSTNAFLSSTEDETTNGAVLTAPSLDGIYYGGSGASSGDGWFFFDATTDALVILYGFKIFVLDQPLKVDAPRIEVVAK